MPPAPPTYLPASGLPGLTTPREAGIPQARTRARKPAAGPPSRARAPAGDLGVPKGSAGEPPQPASGRAPDDRTPSSQLWWDPHPLCFANKGIRKSTKQSGRIAAPTGNCSLGCPGHKTQPYYRRLDFHRPM